MAAFSFEAKFMFFGFENENRVLHSTCSWLIRVGSIYTSFRVEAYLKNVRFILAFIFQSQAQESLQQKGSDLTFRAKHPKVFDYSTRYEYAASVGIVLLCWCRH